MALVAHQLIAMPGTQGGVNYYGGAFDPRLGLYIANVNNLAQPMRIVKNPDGSIDVYFGPKAPLGKEANWVQTVPGKGWFTYFRFYGPTEAFFDKSWALPDIEPVK